MKTDQNGIFTLPATGRVVYEIYITGTELPPVFTTIGTIEVVDGEEVHMGDVLLGSSANGEPIAVADGPIHITGLQAQPDSIRSAQSQRPVSIAAICIGTKDIVHIFQSDGKEMRPPREKDQVGLSSSVISADNLAVGSQVVRIRVQCIIMNY